LCAAEGRDSHFRIAEAADKEGAAAMIHPVER
jgi:hypothetical protein